MMISPEMFYEESLKGKNIEETKKIIKSLKRGIYEAKLIKEKDKFFPKEFYYENTADNAKIWCYRLYLDRAIEYFESLGFIYKYSLKEKRCMDFDNNLEKLRKITIKIDNSFDSCKIYEFDFENIKNVGFKNKDYFIDELKNMHIGEWKNHYDPSRFKISISDGIKWNVKFEFSNGTKIIEKSGSNDYPYNFHDFLYLFNIDINI